MHVLGYFFLMLILYVCLYSCTFVLYICGYIIYSPLFVMVSLLISVL